MNHLNRHNSQAAVEPGPRMPIGVNLAWWRWAGDRSVLEHPVPSGIAEVEIAGVWGWGPDGPTAVEDLRFVISAGTVGIALARLESAVASHLDALDASMRPLVIETVDIREWPDRTHLSFA
jgi:hypothetical protein